MALGFGLLRPMKAHSSGKPDLRCLPGRLEDGE